MFRKSSKHSKVDLAEAVEEDEKPIHWLTVWGRRLLHALGGIAIACELYAIWVLRNQVDVTFFGSLLGFGPRYLVGTPLFLQFLGAPWFNWKHWISFLIGLLLMALVLDFQTPNLFKSSEPALTTLKVVTGNIGSGGDPMLMVRVIHQESAQIVCLQECGDPMQVREALGQGWQVEWEGSLLMASRLPIIERRIIEAPNSGRQGIPALMCVVESNMGPITVINAHLPTPRAAFEAIRNADDSDFANEEFAVMLMKREVEATVVGDLIAKTVGPVVMCGDLNMPSESQIYQQNFAPRLANAFESVGWGLGWTKYTRFFGVRIDHVLYSKHFRAATCRVTNQHGGDHIPVAAELSLIGQ